MPRPPQLIPQWLQPHEWVLINDYSGWDDYVDDALGGPTFLCVFASPKGRNNLLKFKSWTDFIKEYGKPNFKLYGQPQFIPYTALYSQYATCWCMRLNAENATYANLILRVGYKVDGGKLVLKFDTLSRKNIRTLTDLEVYANSLETLVADADGFKYVPLMMFYCLGKGVYGNDYNMRILHDKNADKENQYKNYSVDVVDTSVASTVETHKVTFDHEGIDPLTRVTNFMDDIINDTGKKGSSRIGCKFFDANYETLFEAYTEAYNNQTTSSTETIVVDRLPAITTPPTDTLYLLTEDDGSKSAGLMYAYNTVDGVFDASAYSIEEFNGDRIDPSVANPNIVYKAVLSTTDNIDSYGTVTNGSTWVVDSGVWVEGPTIEEVTKLPSTMLYTPGAVYELSANDGAFLAGDLITYDAGEGAFVIYVDESDGSEIDPMPYTISNWDVFGYNRFTKLYDEFIEIEGGIENVELLSVEGVPLMAGDDGDFAAEKPTSVREKALDDAYINAFEGGQDKKILSVRRAPADLILDACLSVEAKKAMANLAISRVDACVRLDTGLLNNIYDIYDMGVTLYNINHYLISKNPGMMKTPDPISGKNIPVSMTLWMASQYPTHYLRYGNHTPFAGENYAVISGYVKNSIRPIIDADDMDIKEKLLVDYQMNYIEALDEDTWVRGTQTTSQHETSDLSEENNVLVLMEIKRKIERFVAKRRYKWAEAEDLRLFQESCNDLFSSYRGTKCKTLKVRVESNDWEKTRYIVHVYLEVVFRTFQKRAIIEIDVNPRVGSATQIG